MASERAKADEENLRQTAFEKGEWANQPPTDLDVDYDLLSGVLGAAGVPLMSITAEALLALAFCVDELAQALLIDHQVSDATKTGWWWSDGQP